jgi:single-strand DNA-binding protein
MNSVNLMGRMTATPEIKTTPTGIEVTSFLIAINRPTGKDKEKVADFIPCTAWAQTAAFITKYFTKGDMIAVEGSLQSRKYEKDGVKHNAYEVRVNQVHFCGGKKSDGTAPVGADKPNFVELPDGEELPF